MDVKKAQQLSKDIFFAKAKIFKFYDFITDLGYFEVNYSGKVIGLSKKAIILTCRKASSQIQICSSNIDRVYKFGPNMKLSGIFESKTFIFKNIPCGSEKVFVSKTNIKQIFLSI